MKKTPVKEEGIFRIGRTLILFVKKNTLLIQKIGKVSSEEA